MAHPSTDHVSYWTRIAAALGASGLIVAVIGGVVMATSDSASGREQDKVGVCHRTAAETNPYTLIDVPLAEANGHITGTASTHNNKVTWATAGTWRGVPHDAGDERLDYFATEDEVRRGDCVDATSPEPTTDPTTEPTTDPTTDPTTEPTTRPGDDTATDEPSSDPGDGDVTTAPSTDTGEGAGPSSAPDNDPVVLPGSVDAGFDSWSTAQVWGAGLLGGGLAMVLAAGGVMIGARRLADA